MTIERDQAFFWRWLDEQPRTPHGIRVNDRGETRVLPVASVFAEYRARHKAERPRLRELERRKHQLILMAHQLEKEARQ